MREPVVLALTLHRYVNRKRVWASYPRQYKYSLFVDLEEMPAYAV